MDLAADFLESLRRSRLLEPAQLEEIHEKTRSDTSCAPALARRLVRRGWLTAYQAKRLLDHSGQELILGPYRVLNLLGEGGLSQVFKAHHAVRHRIVALKVLHPELRSNAEIVEQFRREMDVLSRLEHPCFVKALDVEDDSAPHYFAMDYIEGIDLHKLLKWAGPLPIPQACNYTAQAALGLQYAFEQGLVHRDIKPGNLVVTFAGNEVRILDIGLARLEWALKERGPNEPVKPGTPVLMGTADYIAPEQAQNADSANIRADIYSLGCSLFHVLTGQPPFPGNSLAKKLMQHQQAPPPSLRQLRPEIPAELELIVQKMMAKNPADRYQTPAGIALALVPFMEGDEPEVSIEQFRSECVVDDRVLREEEEEDEEEEESIAGRASVRAKDHRTAGGPRGTSWGPVERRQAPRRTGNPVRVELLDELAMDEPIYAWVLNRSSDGVGVLVDEPVEAGIHVNVRPAQPAAGYPWTPARVIYCFPERTSWRVGCQFLQKLVWRDLRAFG